MSRRRRIPVESRPLADRLFAAVKLLEQRDPARLERLVSLGEAYASMYDRTRSTSERHAAVALVTHGHGAVN